MPGKGASTVVAPARLPALSHIRVRRPDKGTTNPCLDIMANMLSCWASSGASAGNCAALETQLRNCMDDKKPTKSPRSKINADLMRLYPKIQGPRKKEGVGRK